MEAGLLGSAPGQRDPAELVTGVGQSSLKAVGLHRKGSYEDELGSAGGDVRECRR